MKEKETSSEEFHEKESRLERFVDELVECAELNAWEYGNSGNFLYS
ncbi:MAG: hypothetical protein K6E59_03560 [Bacilli bacterium]|nr:hypothetical protein [Bacilli bacterium]